MKDIRFKFAITAGVLLTFSACVIGDVPLYVPMEVGRFVVADKCPRLTGRYMTKAECVGSECDAAVLSLSYILRVPYSPPQNMRLSTEDKRYADLFFDGDQELKAQIVIGDYIRDWESRDFVCEEGWLKLSHSSESRAEGDRTKANVTSYLRHNTEGDLVVFHIVQGRTSNLFGLAWSNINVQNWLIFRHSEHKTKINLD